MWTVSNNMVNLVYLVNPDTPKQPAKKQVKRKPKSVCAVSLREAYKEKYPDWLQVLDMFEQANECAIKWEHITKPKLQKFVDYMADRLAPNSVNQYATRLKAVLNLYSDEVTLPRDFAKILTPKKTPITSVFLTSKELLSLEQYEPKNELENHVRNIFLISSYTGCRISDAVKLNRSNIDGTNISYVSQKTKIAATIPLKPIVAQYIDNNTDIQFTEQGYNKIIKRICRNIGITGMVKVFKGGKDKEGEKWQFISSHTARKSFASNLYLAGIDLYTISRYMGHTDTHMTEQYIIPKSRELTEEQLSFFN